ncbi:MAG: hypothetical protein ACK5B9_12870 [Flavobacteriia bacterium]|jgi:hypothetical protein
MKGKDLAQFNLLISKGYEIDYLMTLHRVNNWKFNNLHKEKPFKEVLVKHKRKNKLLFDIYKKEVWDVTNSQNLSLLPDFDKRGFKSYHLDHKVSIYYGFKNNILPETIGFIDNLRMIPYKENMIKGVKCVFD